MLLQRLFYRSFTSPSILTRTTTTTTTTAAATAGTITTNATTTTTTTNANATVNKQTIKTPSGVVANIIEDKKKMERIKKIWWNYWYCYKYWYW